jgi:hypothetical protein
MRTARFSPIGWIGENPTVLGGRRLAVSAGFGLAVALIAAGFSNGSAPTVSGWLTFGGGPARLGSTQATVSGTGQAWFESLPGMITTQPLAARNVPVEGATTVYVETAAGFVYALAENGYVRWRADLGRLNSSCPQIPDGWGVTGTPVIDPATRALYVMDAFGRLHALDLATGREHAGWPVVLYRDYRQELDWGALTIADGSVYVPTGSFCDQPPMQGKLIRVELAGRRVSSWVSVPSSLGGGGGIWGWGGPAYSSQLDSIFVATGNAFEGGSNRGASFSEQAGYGEGLVQLAPDLTVRASSKPGLGSFVDDDLVGSPVVADPPGCPELVAAQTKSGTLFAWRADSIGAGPIWRLQVQPLNMATPLLTQPAYSPALNSFFVVTWTSLLRIELDGKCAPHVLWSARLGAGTLEGSPAVTGNTVWAPLSVPNTGLLKIDALSGRVEARLPLGGVSFTPPITLDGNLYLGSTHGFSGRPFPTQTAKSAMPLAQYASSADSRHRWQSREDGVYATDDAGRHWRLIHRGYATRVVRTSTTTGIISVGSPAPGCNCSTAKLWTNDSGQTWHKAAGIGGDFQGNGRNLYWWTDSALFRAAWPPGAGAIKSARVAAFDGSIADATNISGGVAALVDRHADPPQVILATSSGVTTVTLPPAGGNVTPRSIATVGSTLVVRGIDSSNPGASPDPTLQWKSTDMGRTWTVGR